MEHGPGLHLSPTQLILVQELVREEVQKAMSSLSDTVREEQRVQRGFQEEVLRLKRVVYTRLDIDKHVDDLKKSLLEAVDRVQDSCDTQIVSHIKRFNHLEAHCHLQNEQRAGHGKKPHLLLRGRSSPAQVMSTEITDPSRAACEQNLPEIKQAAMAGTLQEFSGKREYQHDLRGTLLARIGQLQLHDHPEKVASHGFIHLGQCTRTSHHEHHKI